MRNAACHRALAKYKDELNQNYWILIFNNFLHIAILEWCKVFGSHSQPTHWKKIVDDHSSFRQGLLETLEIRKSDWDAYWKDLKDYRDKFVAHHLVDPNITHYPSLDIALESSFHYYIYLINRFFTHAQGLGAVDNELEKLKIIFDERFKQYNEAEKLNSSDIIQEWVIMFLKNILSDEKGFLNIYLWLPVAEFITKGNELMAKYIELFLKKSKIVN